jgi:hypothetical protein
MDIALLPALDPRHQGAELGGVHGAGGQTLPVRGEAGFELSGGLISSDVKIGSRCRAASGKVSGLLTSGRRRREGPGAMRRLASQNFLLREGANASPNTITTRGEVLYVVHFTGSRHTPRSSAARPC